METSKWWTRLWKGWVVAGIIYEVVSYLRGEPLTGVVRKRIVLRYMGSMGMGAFLVWLSYHWLIDPGPGLGWLDLCFALVGAALGWIGWNHRTRRKARDP